MPNFRQKITDSIVRKILKSLSKYNAKNYFPEYYRSSHNVKALQYLEKNRLYSPDQYKYEHKKPNIGNKKVALCLHGFLRTYDKTSPSCLKNIINLYNPDIFIFAPKAVKSTMDASKVSCDDSSEILSDHDEILKKYGGTNSVKALELWDYDEAMFVEKAKRHNLPATTLGISSARVLSFFYHIQKSIALKQEYEKQNGFEYDIVIRARPDLAFYSPFILDDAELAGLENTVYSNAYYQVIKDHCRIMADGSPVPPFLNAQRGEMLSAGELLFNDLISVSNSKNANLLATAYDKLHLYHERGVSFHNEALMAYHIIFESGLNVDIRNFVKLSLFRDNDAEIVNADSMIEKMGFVDYANLHF